MEYRHELIDFSNDLPLKFFLHKIGDVKMHWHRSIELLYFAEGKTDVVAGNESYEFQKGGLLLINSNIPHSLVSDGAVLLALQIKPELLQYISAAKKPTIFDCVCLSEAEDDGRFRTVKETMAQILQSNLDSRRYIDCLNASLCYKLIYELYVNFAVEDIRRNPNYQLSERITTVLTFINANYDKDISLNDLAETLYFTPPYFAKFFKQNMGMTAGDYIKTIRLNHAVQELQSTQDSTEKIGERCGFSNTRSFVDAFKERTGMSPSAWRKQQEDEKNDQQNLYNSDKETGYFNTDSQILFSSISDFLKEYSSSETATKKQQTSNSAEPYIVYADGNTDGTPFKKNNLTFIGVSHIRELLLERVQKELAEVQRRIGFRYVKSHGVFDDCMMVYGETAKGEPLYNFNIVDAAYDFLLSVGLKPLVQLSFTPSLLAKNPSKTTFYNKMITSPPDDLEKWSDLIKAFTTHMVNRFGEKEVSTWLFTVWNEPNTSEHLFGFKSENDYFKLYRSSYLAVKSVCPSIPVGGPSSFSAYGKKNDWIYKFLGWAKDNDCFPAFLDVHYYDADISDVQLSKDGKRAATRLSPAPSTYSKFLNELKNDLAARGFDLPVTITEWNSTTTHRDPLSDTCFKSCYIVKNQVESLDAVDGSGYWLLTDLHSEMLLNDKIFHGGLGMYTINGIRKPAFFAYEFLSLLKERIVSRGNGYVVTKGDGEFAILLYNYFHYSLTYAQEVGINTSYTDRYSVFPDKTSRKFDLDLILPDKKYTVQQAYVNRDRGSAFDEFVKMGGVEPLSKEETDYLASCVLAGAEKSVMTTERGKLQFSVTLEPLEIRLIRLFPML